VALRGYEVLTILHNRLGETLVEFPSIHDDLSRDRANAPLDGPVVGPIHRDELHTLLAQLSDFILVVVEARPSPKEHNLQVVGDMRP